MALEEFCQPPDYDTIKDRLEQHLARESFRQKCARVRCAVREAARTRYGLCVKSSRGGLALVTDVDDHTKNVAIKFAKAGIRWTTNAHDYKALSVAGHVRMDQARTDFEATVAHFERLSAERVRKVG